MSSVCKKIIKKSHDFFMIHKIKHVKFLLFEKKKKFYDFIDNPASVCYTMKKYPLKRNMTEGFL